jgi:hypothetical protein
VLEQAISLGLTEMEANDRRFGVTRVLVQDGHSMWHGFLIESGPEFDAFAGYAKRPPIATVSGRDMLAHLTIGREFEKKHC